MAIASARNKRDDSTMLLQNEVNGEIIFKRVPDKIEEKIKYIRSWDNFEAFEREYLFYTKFKEAYEAELMDTNAAGRRKIDIPE